MDKNTIEKLIKRVNNHFDYQFENGLTSYEFCATKNYLKEHDYCYTVGWCLKNEIDIHPSKRTLFAGAGPIMVSKISEDIEMSGSSPKINFVKKFEFRIRGLEPYWNLKIEFDKTKLSALKTLLHQNTPELLKKVDINFKINITGEEDDLIVLKEDLSSINIKSILELKGRKISE